MLESEKAVIHLNDDGDEQVCIDYPNFDCLADINMHRKEILWSVIGMLMHFKNLFIEAPFEWCPKQIEALVSDIENATMPFIKHRPATSEPAKTSPDTIRFNILRRIIVSASKRQGISPFNDYFFELDPKLSVPAKPGQLRAFQVEECDQIELPPEIAESIKYMQSLALRAVCGTPNPSESQS